MTPEEIEKVKKLAVAIKKEVEDYAYYEPDAVRKLLTNTDELIVDMLETLGVPLNEWGV